MMYSRVAHIVKIPLSPQKGAEMKKIVNIENKSGFELTIGLFV